jgi:hypothetical protein
MKPWQRRAFNALAAIVSVTGAVYFWMKYMLPSDDPLAVVNHPLQPLMLDLHVLSGPGLLLMFGIVFNAHVASKLARRIPLRRSGLTALGTFATMAATGYLLQVVVSEQLRLIVLWLHLGSGAVFVASYGFHLVVAYRPLRRVPPVTARASSA